MIAIPNMKMPMTCDDCIVPLSKCDFLQRRADDCPLIDIVRCGECKWGDTGIDEEGKPFWKCIGIHYGGTKPTDFCSYGERK